jgi:DNA-binding SARP family transcriptional activator
MLCHDDFELPVAGLKDRALLALLALQHGKPLGRTLAASLLWSDTSDPQARQNLRQALVRIRRIAPVLAKGEDELRLAPEVESDVSMFLALLAKPKGSGWRQAIDIADQPLLDGFQINEPAFMDWLDGERRQLSNRTLEVLDALLEGAATAPEAAELSFLSTKAIKLDPYREKAHRHLMEGLARQGLRLEALQHYRDLCKMLKEELDVQPEPETRAVHDAIRSGRTGPILAVQPREKPQDRPAVISNRTNGPRVAVLPLADPANDHTLAHLTSGIAGDIANALASFHSVAVLAPASTFRFAAKPDPLEAIRSELQADYLVTGSIQRSASRLRLDLQLIDVETGMAVWGESHAMEQPDPDFLEGTLIERIVARIEDRIIHERIEYAHRGDRTALAAYDCWLRGQHILLKWQFETEQDALSWFDQALALDPRFARAHSSISLALNSRPLCAPGWPLEREDRERALFHARLAVECDPHDPRSHFAIGWVSFFQCDVRRARRAFETALELNPRSADVLMHAALAFAFLGEAERGVSLSRRAIELNPLYPDWYCYFMSVIECLAGNYDASIAMGAPHADAFLELGGWVAAACILAGRRQEAMTTAEHFRKTLVRAWAGSEPMRPGEELEWFLSVNRWLTDRDRGILLPALQQAGIGHA